jgi:CRP/FNR family transcriptional regulator, cyclic AMP receptor protein
MLAQRPREKPLDTSRLKKIDLFSGLDDDALERVAGMARETTADEGEKLVQQDAASDQLIAIEEGTVEVRSHDEKLATLGEGDVVGEAGLLKRGLRNADVVATGPVKAIFFTQDQVRALRRDLPDFDERLQRAMEDHGG